MSREVRLAGCAFEIEADGELSEAEAAILDSLKQAEAGGLAERGTRTFRLRLVTTPPWPVAGDLAQGASARVSEAGGRVRVTHTHFLAEIDAAQGCGRLFSPCRSGAGLGVSLRLALASWLPSCGGLPLHAAGVVSDGSGLAFFGPSGAGKSTLAASSPFRVLSDELVVVRGAPPHLMASGFWGSLADASMVAPPAAPLLALVELAKGRRFRLSCLHPEPALRRLLRAMLVPPVAHLWRPALDVAAHLVRRVPTFRMEWSPDAPPWTALIRALKERRSDRSEEDPLDQTGGGADQRHADEARALGDAVAREV